MDTVKSDSSLKKLIYTFHDADISAVRWAYCTIGNTSNIGVIITRFWNVIKCFSRRWCCMLNSVNCGNGSRMCSSDVEGTGGYVVSSLGWDRSIWTLRSLSAYCSALAASLSSDVTQHSRERINELVLGQMSSIVNAAGNSGSKGTSIAVRLCKPTRQHSPGHLHAPSPKPFVHWILFKCDSL